MTTDRSTYTPGETVIITVTITNTAGACSGADPGFCGIGASVSNQARNDVWDSWAQTTINSGVTGCPSGNVHTIPVGWSTSTTLNWTQRECVADTSNSQGDWGQPNPECPRTQVPDGTYSIVGFADSAPAAITISS